MRFQRLKIPAFGPFTKLDLSFPPLQQDLHIFYGENEAGKSSLLRAIRDLLFGIPGNSPDKFLHEYKNLLLVSEIVNRAGERLAFQRRKGNKNTLLDMDGKPLPDGALRPFLGNVDLTYFSAMFGLGGTELREGAVQLLAGEGEIGNALFSASLGGTPIQRVLDALVEESERLYKGRALANVSIRPAANRHRELLKQSREATVSPETWDQLQRDLERHSATQKSLEGEIDALSRELVWVGRCEDALPNVGRLNDAMRLLSELPGLPDVASDFVDRAKAARAAVGSSSDKVQTLTERITQLKNQLANCVTSPRIMAVAEALDLLHQDLGAYRQKKELLAKVRSKLTSAETVLRAGMKSLEVPVDLELLESFRLNSAQQLSCEGAANALQTAMKNRDNFFVKVEGCKESIATCEANLRRLPEADLKPLRDALAVAAEATDADKTLAVSQSAVAELRLKVMSEKSLVFGLPEDLDAACELLVPAPATIRRYREKLDELNRDIKLNAKQLDEEALKVEAFKVELNRLERRGELPSEESLRLAREHRDQGWQLVLDDWKGDGAKAELEPGSLLEEAFPQTILMADKIADQLRLDAEAVAQAEEKRLQIRNGEKAITKSNEKLAAQWLGIEELQRLWEQEWVQSGVHPRSPIEMEEWRDHWIQFRQSTIRLREVEAACTTKLEKVRNSRDILAAALVESPEQPFSVLFGTARSRVQQGEVLTGSRNEIERQLEALNRELESFDRKSENLNPDLEAAEKYWKLQCQAAGLSNETAPDIGLRLLQERRDLFKTFDNWKELSAEVGTLTTEIQQYEQSVHVQADSLGIAAEVAETQEAGLWKALTQARNAQTVHDQLVLQIQSAEVDLATSEGAAKAAFQELERLMRLVVLESPQELEPLLANLEKRATLQERIDSYRETLSGPARGEGVNEFIARVQAEDADQLPQRKLNLESNSNAQRVLLEETKTVLIGLHGNRSHPDRRGEVIFYELRYEVHDIS